MTNYSDEKMEERINKAISRANSEKLERLRDEFAMHAMGDILSVAESRGWYWMSSDGFLEVVAKKSYMAADAMLKAREVQP